MNKRNPVLAAGIAVLFASIFLGACGNPSEADKTPAAGESAAGIFESIEQEDTGDKAGDARGDLSGSSSEKAETDAGSESGEPSETSKAGETAETAEKKADAGDSDLTIPADKAVYENTTMPAYVEGLWVAGVGENRDFPVKQTTDEESLKKECDQILEDAEAMGINVIFFHVRPSSDAFYKSELYPWSRYLTGTQGLAPENDFDPLDYMVKGAHERGIQLHAWINPYRIRTDDAASTPEGEPIPIEDLVTGNHALTRLSTCILPCDDGFYYLDPAEPAVRETVVNGALEIVKGYDVDGIHMDDYFYPSAGIDDSASYAKYGNGMDIGDWRRTNVNLLVKELDSRLHEADPDIAFGISPSGIWANKSPSQPDGSETGGMEARNALYADSVTWIENGWIDYIIPQIYWEIGKEIADYSILLPWWSGKTAGTDVRLFIGMADYRTRLAKDSPDSVWHGSEELVRQLKLNDTIPEVTGEVHFNYTSVVENEELFDIYSKRYGK